MTVAAAEDVVVEAERAGRREARAENRLRRTVWGLEFAAAALATVAVAVLVFAKLGSRDWWRRVAIVSWPLYLYICK